MCIFLKEAVTLQMTMFPLTMMDYITKNSVYSMRNLLFTCSRKYKILPKKSHIVIALGFLKDFEGRNA